MTERRNENSVLNFERVKILNTKFEALTNIKLPKFKTKKLKARNWRLEWEE